MSPIGAADIAECLAAIDRAGNLGRLSTGAVKNLTRWLTEPALEHYRHSVVDRIRASAFEELDALFWEVIPFGTGGRRGRMAEIGTATINERTIAESAHGLAVYLKRVKAHTEDGPGVDRAVVAYDTRHRSIEFARITATTFAANGFKVFLFDAPRATPELSFAVRRLGCDVGVMISASHNPPTDNGFKAYWNNGGQVLPPHDRGIVDCVREAREIPTVEYATALANGSIELVGADIDRLYVSAVASLSLSPSRNVRAIFTPLHGVGESSVARVLSQAGFSDVEIFEPQREQNGDFPNVPRHLPNPEVAGALEPACKRAAEWGAELVLASDPDADRLGVAVRAADGRFVPLTGNQVGSLLLDYVLRKHSEAGTLSPQHFACTTLVTTPLLRKIGDAYRIQVIDDLLVGFKYIGQMMDERGADRFVFGAEESLGYLAGDYCRDKDAAIAALYVMELAAELRQEGRTLLDGLDRLHERYGNHAEAQSSLACAGHEGQSQIATLLEELRNQPPTELAGHSLNRLRDYRQQTVHRFPVGEVSGELHTVRGDLLFLDFAGSVGQFSIAIRPSGTEPKVKFYFFAQAEPATSSPLDTIRLNVNAAFDRLQHAFLKWADARVRPAAKH